MNKTKFAYGLWDELYGNERFAEDFAGNLMCRDGYNDRDYYVVIDGEKIYCGWNLFHCRPRSQGGKLDPKNILLTNIATNDIAGDKTTFYVDDALYQIHKVGGGAYQPVRIN